MAQDRLLPGSISQTQPESGPTPRRDRGSGGVPAEARDRLDRAEGGTWEGRRQEVGEHLIDTLTAYAPNFRKAMVDWVLFTPADLETRVGLTDGNIRHLDIVPAQMFARRPLPGWARYQTPLRGLYLCGAGTHPGGEVTGAPGHNAAHAILQDLMQDIAAGD